jgi:autotransporter-associated beta strand protein
LGFVDTAPVQDETKIKPLVDFLYTNQRSNNCWVDVETNAGIRVANRMLDLWEPKTMLLDADQAIPNGGCTPVTPGPWSGVPGDGTDGKVLNQKVHDWNIEYCVRVTKNLPSELRLATYFEDRRRKGYALMDALGPNLVDAWRKMSGQTTTIVDIPADATTVRYNDGGNDIGDSSIAAYKPIVDFIGAMGADASTEPAKRFFKYARPFRWSSDVVIMDALVPVKSTNPKSDGGYISGHTAEGYRKSIGMAYLVPERFQEFMYRGFECGENRIRAGYHSPLDVLGGRVQGTGAAVSNIYKLDRAARKQVRQQARALLLSTLNRTDVENFISLAQNTDPAKDAFADKKALKEQVDFRFTYGFPTVGPTDLPATVPKGAEALLETRFPYLTDVQLRVLLKVTAFQSGYPINDDEEGWGRLNYFLAGGGFTALNGDLDVTMDASLGDFNTADTWTNDIKGAGKLTKSGTGALTLVGSNTFTGGVVVAGGRLIAGSINAFGQGDVFVSAGAVVVAKESLSVGGAFTVLADGAVEVSSKNTIAVAGAVNIAGGVLTVSVAESFKVIEGKTVAGTFAKVDLPKGFTVKYTTTSVEIVAAKL